MHLFSYSVTSNENTFLFQTMKLLKILLLQIFLSSCCALNEQLMSINACLPQDFHISELLRLKMSLEKMGSFFNASCDAAQKCVNDDEPSADGHHLTDGHHLSALNSTHNLTTPAAMALVAQKRDFGSDASSDYHAVWQPEEKPSKLQTLFQISITALAFLSFGGYLLCLIVQGIKSKGTTYFHPVTATGTTTSNNVVKRIKIYRRSRRYAADGERTKGARAKAEIVIDQRHNYDNYTDVENEEQLAFPAPMDLSRSLLEFTENRKVQI